MYMHGFATLTIIVIEKVIYSHEFVRGMVLRDRKYSMVTET